MLGSGLVPIRAGNQQRRAYTFVGPPTIPSMQSLWRSLPTERRTNNRPLSGVAFVIDLTFGIYHYIGGELLECAALNPAIRPLVRSFRPLASPNSLLFIHVPRNAGVSIRAAMGTGHRAHRTLTYYRAVYPGEVSSKTTFAVIRDPISRFRSAYQFVVGRGAENAGLNGLSRLMTAGVKSIDDYISFLEDRRHHLDRLDSVMRTQSHYAVDEATGSTVDELFALEHCSSALSDFLIDHGFNAVGRLNRSAAAVDALTKKQTQRVEQLYAQDMELHERARTANA